MSCLTETVTVKIENATEGGIVYFRTDTAYNMIPSVNGTIIHECVFEECNIEWDVKFYVVVQRRILYQSSSDVIIWFACNTNSGAISAIEMSLTPLASGNLTTSTYRPEVSMDLYSDNVKLVNQAKVKLGDQITMIIHITNDPANYFDINPKSCYASGITLYEDRCPVSDDLLGFFNTTIVGTTSNTFSMFRPTSLGGGPVEVVFTCILEVCDGTCGNYECTNSSNSQNSTNPVRKRRATGIDDNPNVIRGFTLTVVTEEEENKPSDKIPQMTFCLAMYLVVAIFGSLFLSTAMTITYTGYNYQRSSKIKEQIFVRDCLCSQMKKLDDNDTNQLSQAIAISYSVGLQQNTTDKNKSSDKKEGDTRLSCTSSSIRAINVIDEGHHKLTQGRTKSSSKQICIKPVAYHTYRRKSVPTATG
ncbi:hypothetical protein ACF0H5_007564 [Mactra antiquata]